MNTPKKPKKPNTPTTPLKKPNLDYYRRLLEMTPMSHKSREYYHGVLDSIELRGGVPTVRQADILRKIKEG